MRFRSDEIRSWLAGIFLLISTATALRGNRPPQANSKKHSALLPCNMTGLWRAHKSSLIANPRRLCFVSCVTDARELDDVFTAPLRGECAPWPPEWASLEHIEAARRRLIYHGICGLLYDRMELLQDWPDSILKTVHQESVAHAMWELRHRALIAEVVESQYASGITSVLLKGTAFAYSIYANPAHRFRGDSDLLISSADLDQTQQILDDLGWFRPAGAPGPFGPMHYQEIWQFRDPAGFEHDIDLHWQVTNSMALRTVLEVDDVIEKSTPLPSLSSHARCADPVTALIHRAINRRVHAQSGYFSIDRYEYDPDRLIWAFEIDLLAKSFTKDRWVEIVAGSRAKGVATVVKDALSFAEGSIRTEVPSDVLEELAASPRKAVTAQFLASESSLQRHLYNIWATPGVAPRLQYILARAFPAQSHLRGKYPLKGRWPLPFLYLFRFIGALRRHPPRGTQ